MEESWVLSGSGQGMRRLRTSRGQTISPVWSVSDVCRRLRKSQRQVYRYLREGTLTPCAQVLGQWLFAPAEVERYLRSRVPRALQRFFWDARVSSLAIDQHRDFILARLLEFGDRRALRWVLQAYPRDALVAFVQGRGADLLSTRAQHFWAVYLGSSVPSREHPSWRARGRAWGGLT